MLDVVRPARLLPLRIRTSRASPPVADAPFYAGLSVAHGNPEPASPPPNRRPGTLSAKQANTFLGEAAKRIKQEARDRSGKYLFELDRIHRSGCRTKQQRWNAIAALAEPMLSRIDLATLVMGWETDDGEFRLNRQRRLALDTSLSDSVVSRSLSALEAAKYVMRKQRRLFQDGQRWITRTMIHLRPRFFIDLGLGHLLANARTKAKAKRVLRQAEANRRNQQRALQELANKTQRIDRKRRAETRERRVIESAAADATVEASRARQMAYLEFAADHPGLTAAELGAQFRAFYDPT